MNSDNCICYAKVTAKCILTPLLGIVGIAGTGVKTFTECAMIGCQRLKMSYDKAPQIHKDQLSARSIKRLKRNFALLKGYTKMLVPYIGLNWALKSHKFVRTHGHIAGSLPIVSQLFKSYIEERIYPLSGKGVPHKEKQKREKFLAMGGEELKLPRTDGKEIDAVWIPGPGVEPNGPTIILYHGNMNILDHFDDYAEFFRSQGLNVLLMTMGGYTDSCPGTKTTETSSYLDVEATLRYCLETKEVDHKNLIVLGHSIGSSLAMKAGISVPGIHVILDQPFAKVSDVVAGEVFHCDQLPFKELVAEFVHGMCQGALPKTDEVDGLNNLKKVRALNGSLLTLSTEKDHLMVAPRPLKHTATGENYAATLARAFAEKHPEVSVDDVHVKCVGDHGTHVIHQAAVADRLSTHIANILKR